MNINLYWTDLTDIYFDNYSVLQHDCLRISIKKQIIEPEQILSFCLTEWPPSWQIEENHVDQMHTFFKLNEQNVTSEQLYSWSATMDLIEKYESYLNKSFQSILSNESFYNCTSPRFGSSCQYSWDFDYPSSLTLSDMIDDYYQAKQVDDETMTCYTVLECDRGFLSSCLDWTEICDGYVDCLNTAVDEINCWQLQLNECDDDQYRCANGQCISKTFAFDVPQQYECLDRSDEIKRGTIFYEHGLYLPSIAHEDIVCSTRQLIRTEKMTSSCQQTRDSQLKAVIFTEIPASLSSECWLAFKCLNSYLFSSTSICWDFCDNEICLDIINKTCTSIIVLPATPIGFGHIHMAYTKEDLLHSSQVTPSYICYNNSLCKGFQTNYPIISINNLTCRHVQDFPIQFYTGGRSNMISIYLRAIYEDLYQCNTIVYVDRQICNHKIMYRCQNSSKCITNDRLCDGFHDCDYKDDELCSLVNGTCVLEKFTNFFKCFSLNHCIAIKRHRDGICDCSLDSEDFCEDEGNDSCREDLFGLCEGSSLQKFIETHISFYTMCDGITELKPMLIDGEHHTDETECHHWPCNNIYTHCDGFWNCLDGSDELECNQSDALIKCSTGHHPCVIPHIFTLSCLSIDKYNDGRIDCVGATDEITMCPSPYKKFYCDDDIDESCIEIIELCSIRNQCMYGDDQEICNVSRSNRDFFCRSIYSTVQSSVEKFLCKQLEHQYKAPLKYFMIDSNRMSVPIDPPKISFGMLKKKQHILRCHQGLPLQIWVDKKRTKPVNACLCPSSYSGDQCQYQNQRVSLTLKFTASSHSRRLLFVIVVTLVDNSDQRTIHSSEQFTFLYIRDCYKKFNTHLLYAYRSKELTRKYFIHIDVYEKLSLSYRASFFIPLNYVFLPVHRIATVFNIPHNYKVMIDSCACVHGRCLRYVNDVAMKNFCQCDPGWFGNLCNIPRNCSCSSDSLCIGIEANHRPICVCPILRWGPKCLIKDITCQIDGNTSCYNGGQCVPHDKHVELNNTFYCLCRPGFSGKRCDLIDIKIILSFDSIVRKPPKILIHFLEVITDNWPRNGSTFKIIPPYSASIVIQWSHPFHIAFLEFSKNDFYLLTVQSQFNRSETIEKTITEKDRCINFNDLVNKTIAQYHLLRRMKFYHFACQQQKASTHKCFYDVSYFCLCDGNDTDQRIANCFPFNASMVHNCLGHSSCENGAQCLQDRASCPQTSVCVCPRCFHGARCQFRSNFYGLSLDAILGQNIQPRVNIREQPLIIKFALVFVTVTIVIGLINGLLLIMALSNPTNYQIGCGYYLLGISICTLLIIFLLGLKFSILLISQMVSIKNILFLQIQCHSLDFLLQIFLNMERWLSGCVSIERMIALLQGIKFNKTKSKRLAKYIISILFVVLVISTLYDPLHRRLFVDTTDEMNGDNQQDRIWCIVAYSSRFQTFNSLVHMIHFFVPFSINIICSIVFIKQITQRKKSLQQSQSYREVLRRQLIKYAHLIISPISLIILSIPRITISFLSNCIESTDGSWLPLIGYFVSFLPAMATFLVFVLPSKMYKDELRNRLTEYRQNLSLQLRKLTRKQKINHFKVHFQRARRNLHH